MPEADQTNPTPTFKSLERDGYHAQAPTYGDRPGRLTRQAIAPMLQAVAAAPGMRLLELCADPDTAPAKPRHADWMQSVST